MERNTCSVHTDLIRKQLFTARHPMSLKLELGIHMYTADPKPLRISLLTIHTLCTPPYITSHSCVTGIASSYARRARRVCVCCSYAYAYEISSNSLHAVPRNDSPMGTPGAGYSVSGPASAIVTFSG